MKAIKILSISLVFSVMSLVACNSDATSHEHEQASTYNCPMKCEGEKTYSDEGSCPVCGMDLVEI